MTKEYGYICQNCRRFYKIEQLEEWEHTLPAGWRLVCPNRECRHEFFFIVRLFKPFEEAKKVWGVFDHLIEESRKDD